MAVKLVDIKTKIDDILGGTYITMSNKKDIEEQLTKIKASSDGEENDIIDKIIETLECGKLKADRKKEIKKIYPNVLKIVKKYEETYEEEENTDDIDEDKTIEEVEKILDEKIPKYNNYSENNPMKGLSWNSASKSYTVKYGDLNIKVKNLETACGKIISEKERKNAGKNVKISPKNKKYFTYQNHYIMTYWIKEIPYFDIQHIISLLNIQTTTWNEKYAAYKENIRHIYWHKNIYNGYIERELITEKTMYKIILSSQSKISKTFKDDIAEILVTLRAENKLDITNDSIKLSKKSINTDTDKKKILEEHKLRSYTYTKEEDKEYAKTLVGNGSIQPISKYMNNHVLYGFILALTRDHEDIIVKFGYTENIAKRYETLKTEYGCEIYMIGIKKIRGESDEQQYHKMLKEKYSHLIEHCTIGKKEKIELYKLNPVLMREFDEYKPCEEELTEPKKISKEGQELIEYIEKQKENFVKHLDQFNDEIKRDHYEYLIKKEETKQKEIEKQVALAKEATKQLEIEKQVEIEKEKTKQAVEKTKQKELEIKILELQTKKNK
jgi:prophage antirepressor-like protein